MVLFILAGLMATGAVAGVIVARLLAIKPATASVRAQVTGAILGLLAGAGVWFVLINMVVRLARLGG